MFLPDVHRPSAAARSKHREACLQMDSFSTPGADVIGLDTSRRTVPRQASGRHDTALLARDRASFLLNGRVGRQVVRAPIVESWKRARRQKIPADCIDLPGGTDIACDTPFVRAAAPVVRDFAEQLASEPVSVILCDSQGVVIERRTGDSALHQHLDKVWLAPGFSYAENTIGTNAIGTALEDRRPTQVIGYEHYVEGLADLACAGHPIHHPVSRQLLGVIDLTTWRRDANNLMIAAVLDMSRRIEQILLEQIGRCEFALLNEYLLTCSRSRSAVLAIGDDLVMMNDQARRILNPADQASLLEEATEMLSSAHRRQFVIDLPSGITARVQRVANSAGDAAHGGVMKVNLIPQRRAASARTVPPVATTHGCVGSAALWTMCCQKVDRHFQDGEWLILVGEPGVGKVALASASHRGHTPAASLQVMDLAGRTLKWTGDIAEAMEGGGGTLVLRHLDHLDDESVQALADVLEPHRDGTRAGRTRVIATVTSGDRLVPSRLGPLLATFPHTVEVPPLRHHVEDIVDLVPHLVARLARGADLTLSAEAIRLLMRNRWPGNVGELVRVLSKIVAKRRAGVVTLRDLPPEAWSIGRRVLTQIETIECDAIVHALLEKAGSKAEAAHQLGMSRATIYRKIHDFGIVVPVCDGD
jgi:sigma-54 dependent transcriptional regulator, acetoin dehydrogenase operon transcriptional activator AcoR